MEFMGSNQNVDSYFPQGNVDEKEAEAKGNMNKVVMEAEEKENEIQKLSEELMAYEKYMKFYQISYYDGQLTATNNVQESMVGDLWCFDDEGISASSVVRPIF